MSIINDLYSTFPTLLSKVGIISLDDEEPTFIEQNSTFFIFLLLVVVSIWWYKTYYLPKQKLNSLIKERYEKVIN